MDLEFVGKYFLVAGAHGRPKIYKAEDVLTIDSIGLELAARDFFVS